MSGTALFNFDFPNTFSTIQTSAPYDCTVEDVVITPSNSSSILGNSTDYVEFTFVSFDAVPDEYDLLTYATNIPGVDMTEPTSMRALGVGQFDGTVIPAGTAIVMQVAEHGAAVFKGVQVQLQLAAAS